MASNFLLPTTHRISNCSRIKCDSGFRIRFLFRSIPTTRPFVFSRICDSRMLFPMNSSFLSSICFRTISVSAIFSGISISCLSRYTLNSWTWLSVPMTQISSPGNRRSFLPGMLISTSPHRMKPMFTPKCSRSCNSARVFPAMFDSFAISNVVMCPSHGVKS